MLEEEEVKKSFFDGAVGKYLLPDIILQSVLIGGGYATGREIVEYGARFGALGWWSGLATGVGFALLAFLSFEIIRLYKVYDFKSFLKELIGPLYHIFDIVYFFMMIIIIAIMASAAGSVVEQLVGVDYWVGVAAITIIVGFLNFYGENLISFFETFGTVLLYIGYICFSVLVIGAGSDNISRVLATGDHSFTPDATVGLALWTGILYTAYNLVVFPASFFTVKRHKTHMDAFISAIIAGLLMVIPWFLTYFAVLGFYPSKDVVAAPVPWVSMMQAVNAPGWLLVVFSFVMGWTLIETATGIIHALLTRIDSSLENTGREKLSRGKRGLITVVALGASVIMAKVGIIDLIAKGYNAFAYGFIVLYMIPVLTVGVYKIIKKSGEPAAEEAKE